MDQPLSFKLILAFLILLSRLADLGSTYLVSPKLELESNVVMKRLKWPYAFLTLFVFVLPYWSVGAGIVVMVASFLVAASNSSKILMARTLGESEYRSLIVATAARAVLIPSLIYTLLPALFMVILGWVVMYFYPNPEVDLGYYVGLGIVGYAMVVAIYGPLTFLRNRRAGIKTS
jgi:hypothetical protein